MGAFLWAASAMAAEPDTTTSTSAHEDPNPLALRGHGRPPLFQSLGQAARNYGSDLVYLYTSPLRMSGKNLVQLGAVAAVGGALYAYDGEIYSGFQRSRENPIYEAIVIDVGGFFEPLGLIGKTHLWYEGAAIAGWVFDVPLLRTIPVEILESNTIVAASRQAIERLSGRERPSDGHGPRSFEGGDSFPSGHISVVCETAAILSHHARHPFARVGIWSLATVAALQRVDEPDRNHWPSDVWIGAAYGAWAGHTIARRNEERRQGIPQAKWSDVLRRPNRSWRIMPVIGRGLVGLTVETAE
jgi:hypothetical protein